MSLSLNCLNCGVCALHKYIFYDLQAMASYANKSACKRRGVVVSFVMVSILVAPILAALAVGKKKLFLYGGLNFKLQQNSFE